MTSSAARRSPSINRGEAIVPQINVSETDKEPRVTAELPGLSEKDIDVAVAATSDHPRREEGRAEGGEEEGEEEEGELLFRRTRLRHIPTQLAAAVLCGCRAGP